MKSIQAFRDLHGTTAFRSEIVEVIDLAKKENNTDVIHRLSKMLNRYPEKDKFIIEIIQFSATGLNGAKHTGSYKAALDDCGRLKPGYKFENGSVVKVPVKAKVIPNGQEKTKETPKKAVVKKEITVKPVVKEVSNVQEKTKKTASNYGKKRKFVAKPKVEVKKKVLIEKFAEAGAKEKKPTKQLALFGAKKTVKKALKSPVVATEEKTVVNKNISDLQKLGFVSASDVPDEPKDVFCLNGEIGKFIQKIQPHKALILLKGTKHTSKSQLAMQIANGFAEIGKPVAYIDYEQGGMESKDTIDSINRNTSTTGRKLIAIKGFLEKPIEELKDFCKYCQVIIADSVTDLGITADQLGELRVSHPKVIWVFISQVKENGEMYGGNKMAHNPTVIIKCHPSENPKERFATLEKNRGNNLDLKYSMYDKKIIVPEEKTETTPVASAPLQFSFNAV